MLKGMFKKLLKSVFGLFVEDLEIEAEKSLIQNGRILENQASQKQFPISKIEDSEFQVFSQFGEDGVISFILNEIEVENKFFVEFGVENYKESNTRFLLMNKNWSGLVIDGSRENVRQIKNSYYFWKYDLKAVAEFVTIDNINSTICENLPEKIRHIGLLSIDIDGNDYYVLDAIKDITADLLIIEYNGYFGSELSVIIPYRENFRRYEANFTGAYFGASINAIVEKAEEKGYRFVGTNSSGNNAFFVAEKHFHRFDKLEKNRNLAKFRQPVVVNSKNVEYWGPRRCLNEIRNLGLIETGTNKIKPIKDLFDI